ncbi:MAG: hypothetical protein IJO59_01950 [Clostridia bacterium]|nr:hypothetical protein [Clostridia bacterium]
MSNKDLPPVKRVKPLDLSHFPSPFYALIYRLWESVPAARLAAVTQCDEETVQQAAAAMGLPPQPDDLSVWEERGYLTTIRNAWHLLPYEQLAPLMGWTQEELAFVMKEEDFLIDKVGFMKQECPPVYFTPLNTQQQAQLAHIKAVTEQEFSTLFEGAKPFAFFTDDEPKLSPTATSDDLRLIFSYNALYAKVLECDTTLSFSDALLECYRAAGINAVWLPVILYQLVPFPYGDKYSEGWEDRQARLRELVARAAKYGIKVYLYLNEPRCMPPSFFDEHPELMGKQIDTYGGALCTELPEVKAYLRQAVRSLCEAVAGLGGFLTITMSENLTHCKSRKEGTVCPRCADVPIQKLVADVLTAIYEETVAVDPTMRVIAWTWAWDDFMTRDEMLDCIDRLPAGVVLQNVSEVKKTFVIGGIEGTIEDYSMSIPGPSELAKTLWARARERGMELCAKVQVSNSGECITIPYLPVFDLIREHMTNLRNEGVKHVMMSWTFGSYPSINLKIAQDCLHDPDEAKYDALLKEEYGEWASTVKTAAATFSEAFREFPFHLYNLYFGPQSKGPANLLFAEPSEFEATMCIWAYDDLDKWRRIYPRDVYLNQWRKLSERWKEGLALVEAMPDDHSFKQMAYAGYALFRSAYLQTAFIMARDGGDTAALVPLIKEERELALLMYRLMQQNPYIGYEASNHYHFNRTLVMEKVLNCDHLLAQYTR